MGNRNSTACERKGRRQSTSQNLIISVMLSLTISKLTPFSLL